MHKFKPRIVTPDEPLAYDRHETAAEIAYRIRNGIRRQPMVNPPEFTR